MVLVAASGMEEEDEQEQEQLGIEGNGGREKIVKWLLERKESAKLEVLRLLFTFVRYPIAREEGTQAEKRHKNVCTLDMVARALGCLKDIRRIE